MVDTKKVVEYLVKKHGAGSALRIGDTAPNSTHLPGVCKSSSPSLNLAVGRGGVFPYGRSTLISGNEGCGKTTLILDAAKHCQQDDNGIVIYMDTEYKLDIEYAKKIGVDVDNMIVSQPDTLEQCMEIIETIVEGARKEFDVPILAVLDSMTAAATKAELEGEYTDQHYAPQARVMSLGLKKLIPKISSQKVALVLVSQLRTKIGVTYGEKDDSTCGSAPKFYSAVILRMSRSGFLKRGDEQYGQEIDVKIVKNQIAPPFKEAKAYIVWGEGFEPKLELYNLCGALKLIDKPPRSSWSVLTTEKFGEIKFQGENGFLDVLANTKGLEKELWSVINK